MLNARLFTPFAPRLITLFFGTVALLAVAISFVTTPTAEACPAQPPQPLRTLYTQSERIVIARAGESAVVQVDVGEYYKSSLVCTTLEVSSTLKGQGEEALVHVYHRIWGEDTDIPGVFKEGDQLLVFLKQREEGHGYEVDDVTYGVKKLSDDEMKIYTKRIEELAKILRQEKPDKEQLLEWLIRCAEEPVSRWDGVLEISDSYDDMIASQEQEKKKSSSESEGDTDAASAEANDETVIEEFRISYRIGYQSDQEFARLLTDEQKHRLGTILFSAQTISYDEYRLMRMVRDWNDARLVPFLLSHLRKSSENADYIEMMIDIVVKALDNEAVTTMAEKYLETDEEEDSEQSADNESASDEEDESSVGEAKRAADAMKREEKLQSFIALAESSLIN